MNNIYVVDYWGLCVDRSEDLDERTSWSIVPYVFVWFIEWYTEGPIGLLMIVEYLKLEN